jgi:hypothetical protein
METPKRVFTLCMIILHDIISLQSFWNITYIRQNYEHNNCTTIPLERYPPRNEDLSLPSRLSFRWRFCDCPYPASRPSLLYCCTNRWDSASGSSMYDTSSNMSPTSGSMKLAATAQLLYKHHVTHFQTHILRFLSI